MVSTAARAGVPVLRSSPSHLHLSYTIANELLALEVRLEITARETLHALRATLLHTHWHTFTLLAEEDIYTTLSLRKDLSSILTTQPLNPKWLSLPTKYTRRALFRRLAEVSRLTRGVIVLICDIHYAKHVMDEAKRLNMLEGHFFWLWIDASSEFDVFHNIGNRTYFTEVNDQELNSFKDKNNAVNDDIDEFERRKREHADNNSIEEERLLDTTKNKVQFSRKNMNSENRTSVKNSSRHSIFRNKIRNINKFETHINNKLLYVNFSRSFNSSQNISEENVRNYVNNKGVETSKNENNSIEKENKSSLYRNISRRTSSRKLKNESFNKYVNSISENEMYESKDMLMEERIVISNDNEDLRDNLLFSSDISDFIMNPTVHTPTVNKFRNKNEDRLDRLMMNQDDEPISDVKSNVSSIFNSLPVGLLALYPQPMKIDDTFARAAVRMMVGSLRRVLRACDAWSAQAQFFSDATASCWDEPSDAASDFSMEFVREMRMATALELAGSAGRSERSLTASFSFLNLVTNPEGSNVWREVGHVLGRSVSLHTIVWPGGRLVAHGQSSGARTIFRIVTALAPPFVMEGELDEDGQCLRGLPCHRPRTSDRDNLTLAFNELERENVPDVDDYFFPTPQPNTFWKMATHCCYGLAMDLLENIAQELEFDFHLYIVEDGLYGARKLVKPYRNYNEDKIINRDFWTNQESYFSQYKHGYGGIWEDKNKDKMPYIFDGESHENLEKWDGIIGDLVSGAAHMSFAALSVSAARAEVIDFSQPYFFSGISILAAPNQRPDIPLLAFLLPFSPELWIAIFTSLNVTAIAVAIYEWLSPFGLNPWGRQRSKNFSISSALWVMWGLLCGHLVAFKAPKSWPNKFLINVWGGFSVIFVASYTANIAALIAGLFFHNAVDNYQGRSNWLSLRVGTAKSSVAEYYVRRHNPHLAQQMRRYALQDIEEGIQRLRNGTLDLLIADTTVLDYYRATDHGCKLQRVGDHALTQDTYAIGMAKGFPLKDSISAVIAKYSSNGYMDILTEKWYGALPCFKLSPDYGIQPKPLGVAAVAGVFILLGVGMIVGCLILILEHLFYKYTLPVLRHQPKGTIWRSRNIMFFSQKLYRFINCVELVSPHHAARELVNTIRQGHFTSLFQKSVKRKEHEQRRRRKSKAQFFEMIQEIRR
ncbi:glutamate receptor ionotropic, NMDA 3B isoform X2 [Bicyclus anynana]|uniref:Glutamate receptor ionotropic, NMDA 3B isoform X2 n=1 Tax=Bicyclus anynana TaxID=110368 RepID=A0ABM3LH85_BICAN|nr:glutamate receptor ionotropic, NMDA 3B isoform X2 [Bicyclus anynana]